MTGYVRQDTSNNISNGSVIDADDLDLEFNGVEAAFNSTTGHNHDGTSGEGAPILVVGPAQDVVVTASTIQPKTDDTVSLGTPSLEFKDLYIDGTANIDNLVADVGTVAGAPIATTTASQTLTNKTINLASNTLVATSAQIAAAVTDETGSGSLVFSVSPALTGTPTAPTAAAGTNTTQLATTAHVFAERTNTATLTNKTLTSPTLNTPTINTPTVSGGTINNSVIGGVTPVAGSFTTLTATSASTGSLTLGGVSISATAAEINKLAGTPAGLTSTELGYVDGVTSSIQTQLNGKQPLNTQLTNVAGVTGVGFFTRATDGTIRTRVISGDGTTISVANGNGDTTFPIISAVLATQAEAEAGTNTTKSMTPARVKEHMIANALGWGQTWQDVSGSRTHSTTYQNTTGRPIMVAVRASSTSGTPDWQVSPDGSTWISVAGNSSTVGLNASFIVPNTWSYRLSSTQTTTIWAELR
jgi:hypothetical protein